MILLALCRAASGTWRVDPYRPNIECTQFTLEALLDAQKAATRRPPFRVTPAHLLVGLIRQRRSSAGELLATSALTEDRIWTAFDCRRGRASGLRRLRDPLLGSGPRWSHAARDVVMAATLECRHRDTAVVDTVDILGALGEVGDPFAAHLLDLARLDSTELPSGFHIGEAHLVELERSPTTQLPSFTALRKLHA